MSELLQNKYKKCTTLETCTTNLGDARMFKTIKYVENNLGDQVKSLCTFRKLKYKNSEHELQIGNWIDNYQYKLKKSFILKFKCCR